MKNKKIVLSGISILLVMVCVISAVVFYNPANAVEKQLDSESEQLKQDIQKLADTKSPVSLSSNPYDYIKDNESFQNIVKLGNEALPIIQAKIEASENDGLLEYMLAIAAEEISGAELHSALDGKYNYSSAKEWASEWDLFKEDAKKNIKNIRKEKNQSTRDQKIKELGVVAIPYLVDEYNNGDTSLDGVICEIISEMPESEGKSLKNKDVKHVIKENEKVIKRIRSMLPN